MTYYASQWIDGAFLFHNKEMSPKQVKELILSLVILGRIDTIEYDIESEFYKHVGFSADVLDKRVSYQFYGGNAKALRRMYTFMRKHAFGI